MHHSQYHLILSHKRFSIRRGPNITRSIYVAFHPHGVKIINILRAVYMHTDPKSTKKTDSLTVFFALSGSVRVKAARKTLVKLTSEITRSIYVGFHPDGSQDFTSYRYNLIII